MSDATLAFIGGGNMARALVGGLLARGWRAADIAVADPLAVQRDDLCRLFPGVVVVADNAEAVEGRDTWLLAVKPQQLREAAVALAPVCSARKPLVISVAAGIPARAIARWLGGSVAVVRSMPNRPALMGAGVTGLFGGDGVSPEQRAQAEHILGAVGATVWVSDEALIDAVTAVSGSGPAYLFLLLEIMETAGIAEGLDAATARTLAVETAYGASVMARSMPESPATLREQVTSRGGTTEAALAVLRNGGLERIFLQAIHAARLRSAELADQFGR